MPTTYPLALPKDFNQKEWEIISFPDPGDPWSLIVGVKHIATGICSRTISIRTSTGVMLAERLTFLMMEVSEKVSRMQGFMQTATESYEQSEQARWVNAAREIANPAPPSSAMKPFEGQLFTKDNGDVFVYYRGQWVNTFGNFRTEPTTNPAVEGWMDTNTGKSYIGKPPAPTPPATKQKARKFNLDE